MDGKVVKRPLSRDAAPRPQGVQSASGSTLNSGPMAGNEQLENGDASMSNSRDSARGESFGAANSREAQDGSGVAERAPTGQESSSSRHAAEIAMSQQGLDAYSVPDIYTGRYTVTKSIGKGAYGAVYIAVERGPGLPSSGRKVALKHIINGFVSATDARRIYREIKVMAHFSHPNIVPLLEVVKPRDVAAFRHIYLVSELMETDLHRVIHSRQDLTSDHIAYFIYQTLCALKHIHAAGVLHRDLKPSNLLVNADCSVKMCDFGLARESDSSLSQALTEYVVTRWYRAPEVLLSGGRYTTAIDMWSAGCVLAELLLRRPLFPGENYLHQLQLITQTLGSPTDEDLHFVKAAPARAFMLRLPRCEPVPWSELMPHVRGPVLDLLSSMLTFDPDKRISVDEGLAHPFLTRVRAARKHVNEDVPLPKPFKLRVPGGSAALKAMSVEAIKARFFAELCGMPLTPSPTASPLGAQAGAFGLFGPMPVLAQGAAGQLGGGPVGAGPAPPGTGVGAGAVGGPASVPVHVGGPLPTGLPPRGPPPARYGMSQPTGPAPRGGLSSLMPRPPPGMPGGVPRPYAAGASYGQLGSAYAGIGGGGGGGEGDAIIGSPSRARQGGGGGGGGAAPSRYSAECGDADMGGLGGGGGAGGSMLSPGPGVPHHRVGAVPSGPGQEKRRTVVRSVGGSSSLEDLSSSGVDDEDEDEDLTGVSAQGRARYNPNAVHAEGLANEYEEDLSDFEDAVEDEAAYTASPGSPSKRSHHPGASQGSHSSASRSGQGGPPTDAMDDGRREGPPFNGLFRGGQVGGTGGPAQTVPRPLLPYSGAQQAAYLQAGASASASRTKAAEFLATYQGGPPAALGAQGRPAGGLPMGALPRGMPPGRPPSGAGQPAEANSAYNSASVYLASKTGSAVSSQYIAPLGPPR